jgi:phenylalanyl-tRNA synthetase alpha chain
MAPAEALPAAAETLLAAREHVLSALETESAASAGLESLALAKAAGISHAELVDDVLKSLVAKDAARLKPVSHDRWEVSEEGAGYAVDGSPEFSTLRFVSGSGGEAVARAAVEAELGAQRAARGLQQALKRRWVAFEKESKAYVLVPGLDVGGVVDDVAAALSALKEADGDPAAAGVDAAMLKTLKQRKLAASKPFKTYLVFPGERIADARRVVATELTRDMLDGDAWKEVVFKDYNFQADGKSTEGGCLHTLLKVREQFRLIFLEMGFAEMPTNNYVESSFWNFDALFQPQQHPARDEHDTFFMSDPEVAGLPDAEYVARVKVTHERGGYGSRGYRYEWSEDEARKNILRTHTTAVSSRMLYKLAEETKAAGAFTARKYFSIDRVFRNETLDATHLAEFHQIEGLVADRNLSLGHLRGIIHEFFRKMGMEKLRFKPTHNPYTTPSLEIHSYHEGMGKWVEVGNSGVFRPEMLRPMGIPEDVTVIAWGLSLERPTMIKYGVQNIRELFGHKVDLDAIRSNSLCRLTF